MFSLQEMTFTLLAIATYGKVMKDAAMHNCIGFGSGLALLVDCSAGVTGRKPQLKEIVRDHNL
jgi:hypothetical protein